MPTLAMGGLIKASPLPGSTAQTAFLPFDNSSVNGSPSGTPAGTFTRASGAIIPDTGLWSNENQILQSNSFNTTWAGASTRTQNLTYGGAANTGWTVTDNSGAAVQTMYQAVTLTPNTTYTVSVYVKQTAGATVFPWIGLESGTKLAYAVVDTNNATASRLTSYSGCTFPFNDSVTVSSVVDGWFRLSITFTTDTTTSITFNINVAARNDLATSGVTVDAAQLGSVGLYGYMLNRGTTAGTYLATTSAAVYSTPRFSSTAKQGTSLLVEESSTQILAATNLLTSAAWIAKPSASTQNLTDRYGNANTAWTVTDTDGSNVKVLQQGPTLSATTYTYSCDVKKTTGAQSSYPAISYSTLSNKFAACTIDTTNGIATTWTAYTGLTVVTSSSKCESVSADWWRCSLTFAATAEVGYVSFAPAYTTNATQSTGTADVAAQGSAGFAYPQLEALPYATSYIPNTASSGTVSRGAESVSYATASVVPQNYTNLLDYSNTLDNAAWTVLAGAGRLQNAVDPFGNANTAWTITDSTTGATAGLFNSTAVSASTTYTASVYIQKKASNPVYPGLWIKTSSSKYAYIILNEVTGSYVNAAAGAGVTASTSTVTDVGTYWWVTVTTTMEVGTTTSDTFLLPATSSDGLINDNNKTGSTVYYGAQLELGSVAHAYLPTTSAAITGLVNAGTIEGWFNFEGVSAGKTQTLWSTYTGAADYTSIKWNGVILYAEKAKTGQVTEYVTITPGSAITVNTWHHVALTINADGTMGLYLDGVADLKTSGADADGLGSELVTNGDFSSDTIWDKGAGWTISGGVGVATGVSSGINIRQTFTTTAFKYYLHQYTVATFSGGGLAAKVGGVAGSTRAATGTFTEAIISGGASTTNGVGAVGTTTASIDNVSIKEIYNSTSTAFVPAIASTMQVGSYNATLQANGLLDSWRFFNRVLTASEITAYYNRGK